jgi:hypothetical protein
MLNIFKINCDFLVVKSIDALYSGLYSTLDCQNVF